MVIVGAIELDDNGFCLRESPLEHWGMRDSGDDYCCGFSGEGRGFGDGAGGDGWGCDNGFGSGSGQGKGDGFGSGVTVLIGEYDSHYACSGWPKIGDYDDD